MPCKKWSLARILFHKRAKESHCCTSSSAHDQLPVLDNDFPREESRKKERDSETEIKELFRIFDKNHDNTISSSELGKMLTCMGMEVSEEEVETLMKELDKNGNGKIEYREFKAFMQDEMRRSEENPEEQEKAIRMAFKVFDQNGDGVIDAAELKTAMKNLGEPLSDKELNDMMKQADIDKDGKINYEEFIRVWSKSMK
ncbi:neo-calmodulin-like isoform X2 [Biomphalaria glabrata]|uniref:Neo-calmodulin-like isoform X2 n=1 Tax=Biomphalaria glabrata TaxID=6526 RepID=A0A9W2Z8V8_BIOGL|nr:neo-calmodulin-like isoform X2 [Biomphalaria glabrata]